MMESMTIVFAVFDFSRAGVCFLKFELPSDIAVNSVKRIKL